MTVHTTRFLVSALRCRNRVICNRDAGRWCIVEDEIRTDRRAALLHDHFRMLYLDIQRLARWQSWETRLRPNAKQRATAMFGKEMSR